MIDGTGWLRKKQLFPSSPAFCGCPCREDSQRPWPMRSDTRGMRKGVTLPLVASLPQLIAFLWFCTHGRLVCVNGHSPHWGEIRNDFGDDDLYSLSRACFRQGGHLETVLLQLLGRWGERGRERGQWVPSIVCIPGHSDQNGDREGQPGLLAQFLDLHRWASLAFLLRITKLLACHCCIPNIFMLFTLLTAKAQGPKSRAALCLIPKGIIHLLKHRIIDIYPTGWWQRGTGKLCSTRWSLSSFPENARED